MTIAFVQKTPNTTLPTQGRAATITTPAFGSAVTVGNIVIACLTIYNSAEAVTFSDSGGNTWYVDIDIKYVSTRSVIAHCYPSNATAITISATISGYAGYWDLGAEEFSGVATGLTAGGSANNSNSGTTETNLNAGQISATGNNLYIGVCDWRSAIANSQAWTPLHEEDTWDYENHNSMYLISSGNQTPAWTLASSSDAWSAGGVAYAEATGGGSVDLSALMPIASNILDTLVKMRGFSATLPSVNNLIGTLISETIIELTAILPSVSGATITLARIRAISATLNNTLNVISTLISESYIELVAALSNELNVSTSLIKERGMSAILRNASNVSGLLIKIRELTAVLNNTSNVSGTIQRILTLLAILNSKVTINATLTTASNLTAETQNVFGFIHVESTIGKINITDNIFAFMKVDPEITIGELHAG